MGWKPLAPGSRPPAPSPEPSPPNPLTKAGAQASSLCNTGKMPVLFVKVSWEGNLIVEWVPGSVPCPPLKLNL